MDDKTHKELERIALEHLDISTLKERKSDSLDFHELSIWEIEKALKAAYHLGVSNAHRVLEH